MKPKKIYGWDGFELTFNDVSVGITPSMGGRIMSLMYQGRELLFVDPQHTAEIFNPTQWSDLSEAKKSLGFRVWGGDKTWVAPQQEWLMGIPPLDLDAAPYALTWDQDQAVMTSPVCRETGVQIVRKAGFIQGQFCLSEELYNRTSKPVRKGLWNVTQVQRPCIFNVPAQEGYFRDYYQEDKTLNPFQGSLSVKQGQVSIDCQAGELFKVGGMPSRGEVFIYINAGTERVCWKKSFGYVSQTQYAHHSAVEIFNSPTHPYAEIELHAPFGEIAPNQSVKLEQRWEISSCSS